MCRKLGLRFAPEIRFLISERRKRYEEVKSEYQKNMQDIVQEDLVQKYNEGEIEGKITKSDYEKVNKQIIYRM